MPTRCLRWMDVLSLVHDGRDGSARVSSLAGVPVNAEDRMDTQWRNSYSLHVLVPGVSPVCVSTRLSLSRLGGGPRHRISPPSLKDENRDSFLSCVKSRSHEPLSQN
jgi:hypothetical protein